MKTNCIQISFFLFLYLCCAHGYPFHASCKLEWKIESLDCDNVRSKLVQQIEAWSGDAGCKTGGEKCLYHLVTNTPKQVVATHTTPKKHYVDVLTFKFFSLNELNNKIFFEQDVKTFSKEMSAGCKIEALSNSETWYAVLDYGTNYCNLHNLITGSGLNKTKGFKENVSNDDCTQYSDANCDVY